MRTVLCKDALQMHAAADAGGDETVWQTCATVAQAAVLGTGGNGLHSRCQLSLRMYGSLPNRVHGPLQDGWQVETG